MTETAFPGKKRAGIGGSSVWPALSLVLCLIFLPVASLRGEDLAFHDVGARAAGLGGAFTGKADDVTAIFYNPAGLAFLGGVRLKTNLGFSHRTLSAVWPATGSSFSSTPREIRGSFFLAWQPVKRVSVGIGYYSPLNFSSQWPTAWSGETHSASAKLRSNTFRAVVAVNPLKGLSFGAAMDFVSTNINWVHMIPFDTVNHPLPDGTRISSRHELSGRGRGFAAGALWKVFPALTIGARYQESVDIDLAGRNTFLKPPGMDFQLVPGPFGPIFASQLATLFYKAQDVAGRLTMPGETAVGFVLTPVPRLSFTLDYVWTKWKEFGRWEFRSVNAGGDLNPGFIPAYRDFYGIEPDYEIQGIDVALKDLRKLKFGVEFSPKKWFAIRAGYARQGSSVEASGRSPLYPDPAMDIYSFGAGYEGPAFSFWDKEEMIGHLSFDLFLRYAIAEKSPSTVPGLGLTYSAERWVGGFGVGISF